MSSHGFPGAGGDQPREEKVVSLPSWQPQLANQHVMLAPNFLSIRPATERPIAPAPNPPSTVIPLTVRPATTGTGAPGQPNIPVKAGIVSAPEAGGRTVVMTTTQPAVTSVVATTTIIGSTPAIVGPATVQLTAAPTLSLQAPVAMGHRAGVGIIHAPPLTAQAAQASLIRGHLPSVVVSQPGLLGHHGGHPGGHAVGHPGGHIGGHPGHPQLTQAFYPHHIPRGAIAGSNLSSPKIAMTTAILHPPQPGGAAGAINISTAAALSLPTKLAQQPRAMLPVRANVVARIAPPIVSLHGSAHTVLPPADVQRVILGHTPITPSPAPVHLSLQHARPALPKPVSALPQQMYLPSHHVASVGHKMATLVKQPGSSATVVAAPKLVRSGTALSIGSVVTPSPHSDKTLINQPGVVTSTLQASAPSLVSGQQQFLGQLYPRYQKIIMTQTGTPTALLVTSAGATLVSKSGPATALNLTQPMPRLSQKPLTTCITMAPTLPSNPPTVAQDMKAVPAAAVAIPSRQGLPVLSLATTGAVTTVTAIPIAKVPPQRQLIAAQHLPKEGATAREMVATPTTAPQVQQILSQQPPGGSIFLSHASHRLATAPVAATLGLATGHSDAQSQVQTQVQTQALPRASFNPQLPYRISPEYEYGTYYGTYSNLMYSPVAAPHPHPFSLPPATALRPGIVPAVSLAGTIQGAAQVSIAGAPSQPVRINPMMVSLDPRQPGLAVHTHYTTPIGTEAPRAFADVGCAAVSKSSALALGAMSGTGSVGGSQGTSSDAHLPSQLSSTTVTTPTASPRPSILRKRASDGVPLVKRNLMGTSSPRDGASPMTGSLAPTPPPKPSVPCDPSRDNSQSSTDTASSAESTPLSAPSSDIKIKQEPVDITDSGPGILPTAFSMLAAAAAEPKVEEASPRKKPRKQLLNANEELKDSNSTDEDEFSAKVNLKRELERVAEDVKLEDLQEYVDEEGVRWVRERKRPNHFLLDHYDCTWKSKLNHFVKPTDVKPKEERRLTVTELANEHKVHQKASGWKLYHMATQLDEVVDQERDVLERLCEVRETVAPRHMEKVTLEDDIGMIHELTQGNIQRCKLLVDQLADARAMMLHLLDHKPRILEVISKHHSKRSVKKKDRS